MNTRLLGLVFLFLAFMSCKPQKEPAGKETALIYCQSCHLLPEPTSLDRKTWAMEVLPNMAARLGYQVPGVKVSEINNLRQAGLLPPSPAISSRDWEEIKSYFLSLAPEATKPGEDILPVRPGLAQFQSREIVEDENLRFITLVHIEAETGRLFVGNDTDNSLTSFGPGAEEIQKIQLPGSPSFIAPTEDGYLVLTMGQVMPHGRKLGNLSLVTTDSDGALTSSKTLIEGLQRPVHGSIADLDGDGKEDMVISSFGYYEGELSWYSDFKSPRQQKHVLRSLPGALKTQIIDANEDGHPDILALMAQGDEGFFLYQNDGKGNFQERRILRFPSGYGSTYFEWQDIDGDGLKDILFINGDNGDYSPIVKDFHGIRFFRNQGNMSFREEFFIEHHGAFKAKAVDFDRDGDLDIAAISYFPDYQNRPEESFIYYENKGDFNFVASTFESEPSGKWLTMDTGDLDGDGDEDIVLGSAFFMTKDVPRELGRKWRQGASPLTILENLGDAAVAFKH